LQITDNGSEKGRIGRRKEGIIQHSQNLSGKRGKKGGNREDWKRERGIYQLKFWEMEIDGSYLNNY